MQPHRKGVVKEFIDGAGYPSPGRWSVEKRRLPDEEEHRRIREIFKVGLLKGEVKMPGGSLKAAFLLMAAGKVKTNPFDDKVIEEVRDKLRLLLMELGYGDGLPREGDMHQVIEVRLMQALMKAFGDPDHYY